MNPTPGLHIVHATPIDRGPMAMTTHTATEACVIESHVEPLGAVVRPCPVTGSSVEDR